MCDYQLIRSANDDLSNAPSARALRPCAAQGCGHCAGMRRAGRGWLQLVQLLQLVCVGEQQFFGLRLGVGVG
jgi:hypothetical protein